MKTRLMYVGCVMRLIGLVAISVTVACPLAAQEADSKPVPQMPSYPGMWINSPPITNEMLAGKAALLYFFDEECPRCVEAWAKTLFMTNKFEGQPVMFIAVNSGTPRPQLEGYLKKNKVNWPTICDTDRSFERQFGFTISLQNIKQVRLLMPDGKFKNGDFNNMEGSAVDALAAAKWKVEPKDIPPALQPAWLAIEFGKYPDAALFVKKSLNGKGPAKEAAQQLNQIVLDDLNAQLAAAKKSLDDDKKWDAFKRYSVIPTRFKGFAVPNDVATTIKELTADDTIKEEQVAIKKLDLARQTAAKSPTGLKLAIKQLQTLVKDHADTEAAREAQQLLDQAGSQ